MINSAKRAVLSVTTICLLASNLISQAPDRKNVIDGAERAFEKAAKAVAMPAPGCAAGVSLNGENVFEKAFGLAEMEHSVPNTPKTIFESGSVAKQFTAAALVLLQQDGKLKIDDDARKYIPELPEYGKPITIRHLLNHTAGLRDWGSVMQLTGAGRGDRVISQELALDVITRQKHLDFVPGAEYSYSNSGYQLAAVIVERVSGKTFSEFTSERIFKPLAMNNSSWRDDYQKIVAGRAQAYTKAGTNAPWRLYMPFMNVTGNGGMLTTVGDWLKWNAALDAKTFGEPFVTAMETQGVLNDGRKITYALGLVVDEYRGIKAVSHGGSTAGYQTYLTRFPNEKISVAVLCNGTTLNPRGLAMSITDEIFGTSQPSSVPQTAAAKVADDHLKSFAGLWRNEKTRFPARLTAENGTLRFNGQPMRPVSDNVFMLGATQFEFTTNKNGVPVSGESNTNGDLTRFTAQSQWLPTAVELKEFAGEWHSEEAQATFTVTVEGDRAFLTQRPSLRFPLQPLYKDHFMARGYIVWVTRDAAGNIERLHVGGPRMRDMWFERTGK